MIMVVTCNTSIVMSSHCRSAAVSEDDPNNVILSTEAGARLPSLIWSLELLNRSRTFLPIFFIKDEPPRCDHNDRPWVGTSSAPQHRWGHIIPMLIIIAFLSPLNSLQNFRCIYPNLQVHYDPVVSVHPVHQVRYREDSPLYHIEKFILKAMFLFVDMMHCCKRSSIRLY